MNTILCLETSGLGCSVAVSQNGDCKAFKSIISEQYRHAEVLHTLVGEVLTELLIDLKAVNAIAVSHGPGSYTGLRVGVSAAKGFCYALSIPLIAVNTLELIARDAMQQTKGLYRYVAMIDARREEVFLQEFNEKIAAISEPKPVILTEYDAGNTPVVLCGDGAEKARKYFTGEQYVFFPDAKPLASTMCGIVQKLFEEKKFENVAYFEPFYLKEFYTGK
ncbi:MAG TPA: tRNA (adenosine(37)-N6)-threonylcarbamoyltransferase complex dimerization subunit type 1 TsaB [Flavobacteriales bacterium]|nr:tRNA (adenosine(37)-N6)-threonylcarbamoyltransferase complex dimerization subunit type 1 TsaB [Flavobacteriales bacterium]